MEFSVEYLITKIFDNYSPNHVPGAASVAQKAESGGVVSKTSVNNHRTRESRKREAYCVYIQIYCSLRSRRCKINKRDTYRKKNALLVSAT